MKLKQAYELLNKSKKFREWLNEHNNCYLSHGFAMIDYNKNIEDYDEWQFGFYNVQSDKITNFFVNYHSKDGYKNHNKRNELNYEEGKDYDIKISKELDILKESNKIIDRLEIKRVKIECTNADRISHDIINEHYPNIKPLKKIFILQNLKGLGNIWNITIVDKSLNTVNIKIDAISGEVKYHDMKSLI